jgi:hypothetical protein
MVKAIGIVTLMGAGRNEVAGPGWEMTQSPDPHRGHRFPAENHW